MHPCLQVPELVREVFLVLDEERVTKSSTKTEGQAVFDAIRALSETCRAFHLAGLPIVWRELNSIFPLMKCFPESIWEETVRFQEWKQVRCMRIISPPTRAHWDLLLEKSTFVKRFKWSPISHPLHPSSLGMLALYRPQDKPIVPNISCLTNASYDINSLPFLHLLLGNNLRTVKLYGSAERESYEHLLPLFRALPSQAPFIEELLLGRGWHRDQVSEGDLGPVISQMKQLHTITITPDFGPCELEVYHALSRLPMLEGMLITDLHNGNSITSNHVDQSSERLFPNLRSLAVRIQERLVFHTSTLPLAQLTMLQLLFGRRHASIRKQELMELFNPQNHVNKLTKLKSLILRYSKTTPSTSFSTDRPAPEFLLDSEVFRYIAYSTRLEVITIRYCQLSVDDIAIQHLAALPNLTKLSLTRGVYFEEDPKVTLDGLLPLLTRCTKLTELRLAVDARATPCDPRLQDGFREAKALKSWDVEDSPISSHWDIVDFLTTTISNPDLQISSCMDLKMTEICHHTTKCYCAEWQQVADAFKNVLMIRNRDRQYTALKLAQMTQNPIKPS